MTDRRTHFANQAVAHISLEGKVDAPRFTEGELKRVATPVANIMHDHTDMLQRQALMGEPVRVLDVTEGRAFGRAAWLSGGLFFVGAFLCFLPWLVLGAAGQPAGQANGCIDRKQCNRHCNHRHRELPRAGQRSLEA